jgi:hypothetical protein
MTSADRTRVLGVLGYVFVAAFVVVLAWTIFSQFLAGAVALRMTVYFAVFVGLSFGFVYGIGARRGSETPKS